MNLVHQKILLLYTLLKESIMMDQPKALNCLVYCLTNIYPLILAHFSNLLKNLKLKAVSGTSPLPPGQQRQLLREPEGQPSPDPHQLLWVPGSALLLQNPQQNDPEASRPVASSTPVPGPSQPAPLASVPIPGPSQPAHSASVPVPGQSQPLWEQPPDSF